MKIAICDDNKGELDRLEAAVKEFVITNEACTDITLKTFSAGLDLLGFSNSKMDFDIYILDIIMPGINGIELAQEIRIKNKNCKIIFLTSSPEFAVSSYNVDAFYYLLKPFDKENLLLILNKASISIKNQTSESLLIKDRGRLTRIYLHTIKYMESVKHTINFHLNSGEIAVCYGKMDEFLNILSKDGRFVQSHRSFIVNMNFVANLESNCFILSDKTIIPIARPTYQQVKNTYIDFFFSKENGSYV